MADLRFPVFTETRFRTPVCYGYLPESDHMEILNALQKQILKVFHPQMIWDRYSMNTGEFKEIFERQMKIPIGLDKRFFSV